MWQVLFRETLKMRSVPEKAVFDTEYHFRTVEACFLHRMLLKMHRVPQEAFFYTECSFRTVEACFWYGALPKTRRTWLSGAQASCCRCGTSNFTKERGRPSRPRSVQCEFLFVKLEFGAPFLEESYYLSCCGKSGIDVGLCRLSTHFFRCSEDS